MIWVKKHVKSGTESEVLAACDESVIGKTLEEGALCMEIKEGFYKGELVEDEKFLEELKNAVNINLVGENTISLAKDSGFVNDVKTIKSVPYALVFKL